MSDDDEPNEMLGLPAFGFAEPGRLRDELTVLVLAGVKIATSSLVADYVIDGELMPVVGARALVYDSIQRPVAIIVTTALRLATIGTVDDEFARAEGEGFADSSAWRIAHERYWNSHLPEYRRGLGDPDFALDFSTPVVCEWFRLVARVDPTSGEIEELAADPASTGT